MPNPVSGAQLINIDPASKLVAVTASVQSSGTQSVQIADSTGKVVYTATGKSSSGGTLTWLTPGTFTSGGSGVYTVTLTSGAGILVGENDIVYQGAPYLQQYNFLTNDGGAGGGDKDFNDLMVSISVFKNKG